MDAQEIVERFIADLKSKKPETSEAHINKYRQRVPECMKFFEARGISAPVEADYEILKAEFLSTHSNGRGGTLSALSIRDWDNQTKQVYDWLKGGQNMTAPTEEETAHVIEAEVQELQETHTEKPKRGRKPNPDKENRVQVSIYLKHEHYEAIKDIANFSGQNISDIFSGLASEYIERNRNALEEGRQTLKVLRRLNFR